MTRLHQMSRWLQLACATLVAATLLSWSQNAAALKPSRHKKISNKSCAQTGLPAQFCWRVGREAYNTDAHEWEDMAAHAQRERGESACDGAQHTVERMTALGTELRAALDQLAVEAEPESAAAVATALGRALHTIQDNCAHEGMPNAQHAWHTLADFCGQANDDPDKEKAAYHCARRETDTVLTAVAQLVEAAGTRDALARYSCEPEDFYGDRNETDPCMDAVLPAPWEACSFLGTADEWDGVDHRWNSQLVGSALLASFVAAIFAEQPPSADLCGGDPSRLARPTPNAPVDTSGGPRSCDLAHLLCFGKVDSTDAFFADEEEAPTPSPPANTACSVGEINAHPRRGPWVWPLIVALGYGLRRRRR